MFVEYYSFLTFTNGFLIGLFSYSGIENVTRQIMVPHTFAYLQTLFINFN